MNTITDNAPLFLGLTGAAIIALTAFGLHVTPEQKDAVLGVESAVIALLSAIANKVTVPKTPSPVASAKSLQQPAK